MTDVYPEWLPKLQRWREEKRESWQKAEVAEMEMRQLFKRKGPPPEGAGLGEYYPAWFQPLMIFPAYSEDIHEWSGRVQAVTAWIGRKPSEIKTDNGTNLELDAEWQVGGFTIRVVARSPQCDVHPQKPGREMVFASAQAPELHPRCQQVVEELEG